MMDLAAKHSKQEVSKTEHPSDEYLASPTEQMPDLNGSLPEPTGFAYQDYSDASLSPHVPAMLAQQLDPYEIMGDYGLFDGALVVQH